VTAPEARREDGDQPDFTKLPDPIALEDTVAEVDTRPVPDPDAGGDPEQRFTLRYGAL
jgi:hypothetical protein